MNAQATCEERLAIRQSLPDLLDPATWPKAETQRADRIIEDVALFVQRYDDPRERLARQVGMLQSRIRELCVEIEDAAEAGDEPQAAAGEPDDYSDEEPLTDDLFADRAAADWFAERTAA